eukprot:CAMPEP_0117574172 /NCGR_PEP_ID=MMETSP0784-20121206/61414_1 /TAXON_ID=39447 /ORGANISM="" /LENGTH=422 /DNA_ID=CAMNT_0005372923 /DNA_START=33 /DNA_END=1297 /DNA_ORIENTATION=+
MAALTASAFVQVAPQSAATANVAVGNHLRGRAGDVSAASPKSLFESIPRSGLVMTGGLAIAAASLRRVSRRHRQATARKQATQSVAAPVRQDIGSNLPDCPKTIWKADDIDIMNLPEVEETSPLIVDALELGAALEGRSEAEYFAAERTKIMEQLQRHGAIWFRNFEMMKDAAGFRTFFEQLELNPCLDPIHTSGLRAMKEKKDAVYEAVNKPALAGHIVGLHNESTTVKTATYGAFGCFKPASEGGGEFMLADGAKLIADMDKDVLKRIYERKVRISVSNLDLNFLGLFPEGPLRDSVQNGVKDLIFDVVEPKFQMDLEMVYGADKTNPYRLSAVEHAQSPINTHPVTGQPVWFCNIHNHSRYLRDRRPCTVPEVGMTDVFYGDLSRIPPEDVDHINEVCERNIKLLKMKTGDVVLIDNYR